MAEIRKQKLSVQCPNHQAELIQYIVLDDLKERRAVCAECLKAKFKAIKIQDAYETYKKYYNEENHIVGLHIQSFHSYLTKSLTTIIGRLEQIKNQVQSGVNQINKIKQRYDQLIASEIQEQNIIDYEQIEKFAKNYYQIFYKTENNEESQSNYFKEKFDQMLNDYQDQMNQVFSQTITNFEHWQGLNMDLNYAEKIFQQQFTSTQIKNSVLKQFDINFAENTKFCFDQLGEQLLIAMDDKILNFKLDIKNKVFDFKNQLQCKQPIKKLCLDSRFTQFAFTTVKSQQTEIPTLNFGIIGQNSLGVSQEISFERGQIINEISIDHLNERCFCFQKNKFIIFQYQNQKWSQCQEAEFEDFESAQFNKYFSLLLIKQKQINQQLKLFIIPCKQVNQNFSQNLQSININLTDYQIDGSLNFFFFEGASDQNFVLFFQHGLLILSKLETDNNRIYKIAEQNLFLSGNIEFCESQKLVALACADIFMIKIFKLNIQQKETLAFSILQISQIPIVIEIKLFKFSCDGKYLTLYNTLNKFQTFIVPLLPRYNNLQSIAPKIYFPIEINRV